MNLGVYLVGDFLLYSKGEGFLSDKPAILYDIGLKCIEESQPEIDRALAGCSHCEFYGKK